MSYQRSTFFARDIVLTHGHEINFIWWMISDIAHDTYSPSTQPPFVNRRRNCAQIVIDYIISLNPHIHPQYIAQFVQTQYNLMISRWNTDIENSPPETLYSVFASDVRVILQNPVDGYHAPDTLTDYCYAQNQFCSGVAHRRMSQGAFYDTQAYFASCRAPIFAPITNQPWARDWYAILGAEPMHRDRITQNSLNDARGQVLSYIASWNNPGVAIEDNCETPDTDSNYDQSSITRIIARWNGADIILLEKIHHYVKMREGAHAHVITMPFRYDHVSTRLVFPRSNNTINAQRCRELLEEFANYRAEPEFSKYCALLRNLIIAKLWGDLGQIIDQYFVAKRTGYRILIRTRDRSMCNLSLLWGLPVYVDRPSDRSRDDRNIIKDVYPAYLPESHYTEMTIHMNPHFLSQDQISQINEYRKSIIAITGVPHEAQDTQQHHHHRHHHH